MRNQQHGHARLRREGIDQLQHFALGGDVERGGRFVGDQQVRTRRERHGDHRTLLLAARKFAGERLGRPYGVGQARARQQLHDARIAIPPGKPLGQGFTQLVANAHDGIQRFHRILEHVGHARLRNRRRAEGNPSRDRRPVGGRQTRQRQGREGLAASGLPHQRHAPVLRHDERDVAHRHDLLAVATKLNAQMLDFQQHGEGYLLVLIRGNGVWL